ncbi:MAG: hypothetical protein WEB00_06180 [Dehalococcoidia bacterium]
MPAGWHHHHFSDHDLRQLLNADFVVKRVTYTGVGLSELVHLPILAVTRGIGPLRALYPGAAFVYYSAALGDDLMPAGRWGYNLTLVARKKS